MLILQVKLPRSVFPLARGVHSVCQFPVFPDRISLYPAVLPHPPYMVHAFVSGHHSHGIPVCSGLSYILSVLYVFFGDVRHLYSVVLTLWMYLSALFYPLELLPAGMQLLIRQNPVYNFIAAARDCILYGDHAGGAVWVRMILWSGGIFLTGT